MMTSNSPHQRAQTSTAMFHSSSLFRALREEKKNQQNSRQLQDVRRLGLLIKIYVAGARREPSGERWVPPDVPEHAEAYT